MHATPDNDDVAPQSAAPDLGWPPGHLRLVHGAPHAMPPGMQPRVAVAIPVCNEVDHIAACLRALERQRGRSPDLVLLLLNNCTDGTQDRVARIRPNLALDVRVAECALYGPHASAGFARSTAMRFAAAGLADHDVLMTTDADATVAADWVDANLDAISRGADAVCGQAEIDPEEAHFIPRHLHEDDARERQLANLLDELAHLVDPDPYDPWPRHSENSGASIAVRVAVWRQAGGMPAVTSGEDRAFVAALRRRDARIRHAPAVRVTVSARTQGRAAGGMAETIARRMVRQDEFTDATIEPAVHRLVRLTLRAQARMLWHAGGRDLEPLARRLGASSRVAAAARTAPYFGTAWALLEEACTSLRPRPVRFADLPDEITSARRLRDAISTTCARAPAAMAR
jgi:GT2 family glycosyltransferase